ncbi:unnamed protein product [Caenorhabditis angaria]|uniref:BZIP domain-containing protein n=1 Tax=Caenorhabditis angaria TaxID=860376 RepID=A0A9P1IAI5_9PELO|nr:unnamed protein product [Caenorhabditis angaria]
MMRNVKTFSSEVEQLRSFLDETEGTYPFLKEEDPVIFHSADYERDLLMSYNLDFGESSRSATPTSLVGPKVEVEPCWPSPSESEVQKSPAPSYRYNPYSSGPLVKEPTSSKRGRPNKATSNTKMATYARSYREMKKTELSAAQMKVTELEEELRLCKEEKARLHAALIRSNAEVTQLRKVIDQDSQIATVVARMSDRSMSPFGCSSSKTIGAGVCVHYGTQGTTVEIKLEDIEPSLELFNGDFSSIEQFINV